MNLLDYFHSEVEKIAESLDYERYESEGGARREGNPWTPMDNSEEEKHPVQVSGLKKVMKDRMKKKKKVHSKKEPVKILTNKGTEYEEADPEKESYSEKIAQVIKMGNNKIVLKDII